MLPQGRVLQPDQQRFLLPAALGVTDPGAFVPFVDWFIATALEGGARRLRQAQQEGAARIAQGGGGGLESSHQLHNELPHDQQSHDPGYRAHDTVQLYTNILNS